MANVTIGDLAASTTPDTDDIVEVEVDGVSKQVSILNLVDVGAAAVLEADYNANSILAADSDNTPTVRTIAEQQVVGRLTSGNIKGLSTTELTTLVNDATESVGGKVELASLSEVTAGTVGTVVTCAGLKQERDLLVAKALYDANTILYATTDNTPAALTVAASTFVGRKSSGNIVAMTAAEALTILGSTYTFNIKATLEVRLMTSASGDVSYTGAGFTPTKILALSSCRGYIVWHSMGFANSISDEYCIPFGSYLAPSANLIYAFDNAPASQVGNLKTLDADGCTITWTKTGDALTISTIDIMFIYIG